MLCKSCDEPLAYNAWRYVRGPIGVTVGPFCERCASEVEAMYTPKPPRRTFRRWLADLIGGKQ
jgi:hypothetical protein